MQSEALGPLQDGHEAFMRRGDTLRRQLQTSRFEGNCALSMDLASPVQAKHAKVLISAAATCYHFAQHLRAFMLKEWISRTDIIIAYAQQLQSATRRD